MTRATKTADATWLTTHAHKATPRNVTPGASEARAHTLLAAATVTDDEQRRAARLVRLMANRHHCTAPTLLHGLLRLASHAGALTPAVLLCAALAAADPATACTHPDHHTHARDAHTALQLLGLATTARDPGIRRHSRGTWRRTGRCTVCKIRRNLTNDGVLHHHKRDGQPCDGGGRPPVQEEP
ncbi:hypothetical protein ACFVH6_22180 [Spirillospora sp. NPDC127200]